MDGTGLVIMGGGVGCLISLGDKREFCMYVFCPPKEVIFIFYKKKKAGFDAESRDGQSRYLHVE